MSSFTGLGAPIAFIHSYDEIESHLKRLTSQNAETLSALTGDLTRIPRNVFQVADDATWLMIIDRQHPGEGYRTTLIDRLTTLSRMMGGLGSRTQAVHVAAVLGSWDMEKGCAKQFRGIVPCRSVMDIR